MNIILLQLLILQLQNNTMSDSKFKLAIFLIIINVTCSKLLHQNLVKDFKTAPNMFNNIIFYMEIMVLSLILAVSLRKLYVIICGTAKK